MDLIITKDFLLDFFVEFDEANEYHLDFKDFLRTKIKGATIITDLKDVSEWEKASEENPLWLYLLDIPLMTPEFVPNVADDIMNISFYSRYKYPYKLFLINKDMESCQSLRNNFGFEYISIENLNDKWRTYYSQREDFNLPIDSVSNPRFDNWAKLSRYKHPVNSVVIIDNYLFCEFKQDGTKQFSYVINLLEMLKNLLSNINNILELQLLIVTDIRNINVDDFSQPAAKYKRLKFVKNRINHFISTEFPELRFDITVVNYDRRIHTAAAEHDRGVYTNYFYFEIGTGLNIFDCKGRIINRSKISFYTPIRSSDMNLTLSGLLSIKTYLQDVSNHLNANPFISREKYLCGSGKNRLIHDI